MLSIGIDVSKGKSTVCGMKPGGEIVYTPFEVQHTREGMSELVSLLIFDFQSQPFPLSADGHGAAFSAPLYWRAAVFLRGLPPPAFRVFPPFRLRG